MSEQLSPSDKAQRHWASMEFRRDFPFACGLPACHRAFKTERGARQHRRTCWHNPEAPCFTSGQYDPILGRGDAIVGFIYNGRTEHERRRIRESLAGANAALGGGPTRFGESHREVVLGPDLQEPCAVCPESRERHADCSGECQAPGCGCREFIGATA